jgi:hypothetical protein
MTNRFNIGDLVVPIGEKPSTYTCPHDDIGIVLEVLRDKGIHKNYIETGRTVRVYWQKSKIKALVKSGWLEKVGEENGIKKETKEN